jgi:hypothetical protein
MLSCIFKNYIFKSHYLKSQAQTNPKGQKFPTNQFVENFIQSIYKIDMCPLAYENHIFFTSMCFLHV